jgi:hypothetical protein
MILIMRNICKNFKDEMGGRNVKKNFDIIIYLYFMSYAFRPC